MEFSHRPVMAREAIELLGCKGGVYVDGTLGGAGHTIEILKAHQRNRVIGIDRDLEALEAARKAIGVDLARASLVHGNFREIKAILGRLGVEKVDGVLLDLGVSSYQFETPERGFSFRFEARLDMRMDKTQPFSAFEAVNTFEEKELERIFRELGEEENSRRISRAIVAARASKPVETTGELVRIVEGAVPARFRKKIHPATKVFQALRIAVNDELGSLMEGLEGGLDVLSEGGRFVVISFHSLEDRMVKRFFRDASTGCVCPPRAPKCVCGRVPVARLVTRKALTPSDEEVRENPRARSAKMRAAERL